MALLVLLAIALSLCLLAVWWQRSSKKYWEDRGVSYFPGAPFVGILSVLFKKSISEVFVDLYNGARSEAISGFFFLHSPSLVIREPELIKRILVRDFNNFQDRRVSADPKFDPIGGNMMALAHGETWRNIRTNVSPIFTGVKMKHFFALMKDVCEVFDHKLSQDTCDGEIEVDVKNLFGLLTIDMISICAFGVRANSINNHKSEFCVHVRKITNFTWRRAIQFFTCFLFPELATLFKFTIFPKSSCRFIRQSINHVMQEREKSGSKRNDLIDVLITMKNSRSDIFFGDVLVAQAAVFLAAGYETTASVTSFTMYELAKHQDIQENLRKEILQALKTRGEITYEAIHQLQYLQMVVQEVLRLYPTLPFLDRVCQPTEGETYSLEPFHKFSIPRGMPIYIPVLGIHRDPKFYPDPNTFNPERFRNNVKDFFFLSFGQGPRGCIGARFGMLQVKLAIIAVLKNYRIERCDRTPSTIRIDKKALIVQSEDPIHLVFKKL